MKSKDLIKELQNIDPTGETEVLIGNQDIWFLEKMGAYYDGAMQTKIIDQNGNPLGVKFHRNPKVSKICMRAFDMMDIPDFNNIILEFDDCCSPEFKQDKLEKSQKYNIDYAMLQSKKIIHNWFQQYFDKYPVMESFYFSVTLYEGEISIGDGDYGINAISVMDLNNSIRENIFKISCDIFQQINKLEQAGLIEEAISLKKTYVDLEIKQDSAISPLMFIMDEIREESNWLKFEEMVEKTLKRDIVTEGFDGFDIVVYSDIVNMNGFKLKG